MGKANRTHQVPPITEQLGDGTFFYNFDAVETPIDNDNDPATDEGFQYDYEQVRCDYPVGEAKIQECVDREGYEHQVDISGYAAV